MRLNVYGNMPIMTPRDPIVPLEAANKNYVDTRDNLHASDFTLHLTPAQDQLLDNLTVSYQELNYLSGLSGNIVTLLGDNVAKSGSTMTGYLTLNGDPVDAYHAATKKYVDDVANTKVSKAGDSMTGALTLSGAPTSNLHAATKQYVDTTVSTHASNDALHITTAQNTFLDGITITSTEVNTLEGITSNVQTQLDSKVAKSGSTMTGALVLSGAPTAELQAATKGYVDTTVDTHASNDALHVTPAQNTLLDSITVTSTEINRLEGITGNVQTQVDSKVAKSGDTMTGALVLPGAPTSELQAATKGYVDTTVDTHASNDALHVTAAQNTFLDGIAITSTEANTLSGITSNVQTQIDSKVAKSGDTMTGALTLPGAPTSNLHAATKQYVDSTVDTHATNDSLHVTPAQNTFLDALSVTSTEVNRLEGITGNVQTQIDTKVSKAGDTMTGALVLPGAPTSDLQAATKGYVDTQDALSVAKSGSTMTGALVLSGAPTTDLQAATKQYVDTTVDTHASNDALHVTPAQNTLLDSITVSASDINQLSGIDSNIQDQIDTKFDKAGGTITGDVTLEAGKTVFVNKVPEAGTELVNKAYVDSIAKGQKWEDPVSDVNLVSDDLSTPPVTPVEGDVYIIGAVATGAWVGKEGYATFFKNGDWVFLQERPVAVGDRFGVSLTSATVPSGGLTGKEGKLVQVSSVTGGILYTEDTIGAGSTTLVFDPQSSKFGVSYTRTDEGDWVPTNTSVNLTAGEGLSLIGNILTVNTGDGLQIESDTVEVKLASNNGIAFDVNGGLYVPKDGDSLTISATGIKVSDTVIADIADKVSKTTGGTVTGNIVIDATGSLKTNATATVDSDVVNKKYVDDIDAELRSDITTLEGTVSTLNTDPVTKDYVNTQDALKVAKAGDTMTGALTLSGAPTSNLHAATKQYVDTTVDTHASNDALHISAQQNTFLDAITVSSTEVNSLEGVTSNVQTQVDSKVAKAGDTMTGALTLSGAPTSALHATTKDYVDSNLTAHVEDESVHMTAAQNAFFDAVTVSATEVNTLSGISSNVQTQVDSKVAKAGDTMTGALTLSGAPTSNLHAATKQYVDQGLATHVQDEAVHMTVAQNSFLDAVTVSSTEVNTLAGVTGNVQTQVDSKVAKAGDTMTGALTLSGAPTSNLHAATKLYVDENLSAHAEDASIHMTEAQNTFFDAVTVTATEVNSLTGISSNVQQQINDKVAKAGDTMTGALTLHADPVGSLHAATKQYVDTQDALKVSKSGSTMSGYLVLHADPATALQAATKGYVDTNLNSHAIDNSIHISAAQNTFLDNLSITYEEANRLAGVTSSVQTQLDEKLNLSGGTLTGALTLAGAPSVDLQAATKKYTDDGDALKVAKAGDTMTGALILSGAPTVDLQASTKKYVDDQVSGANTSLSTDINAKVSKAGDTMTGFLTLHAAPTDNLHASSKKYVDDSFVNMKGYVDAADLNIQNHLDTLQASVDTLNTDPVTKAYVDLQDNSKLAKAGGVMTGYISLHADPQQSMHPATKQYVDGIAQGLVNKPSIRLATTSNLSATYSNGTSGVDSTLTGTSNGLLSVDGKTVTVGDRILVKDQTNKIQNGDYVVHQIGDAVSPFILKRVTTADESNEVPRSYFYVYDGATLKGTGWTFTVDNPVTFTIGNDDIYVNQFSGQGNLIAGSGLTLTGNTFDINSASNTRIVVNADSIDLATTGVTPGTYTKLVVDGYGRVTTGVNPTTLAGYGISDAQPLNANLTNLAAVTSAGLLARDATGDIVTKALAVSGVGLSINNENGAYSGDVTITSNATSNGTASTIVSRDASGNFTANTITANLNGNANTATVLVNARDISASGDISATAVSFNGSANVNLVTSLSATGVTAGDYTKVSVDVKGRVTGGSNPTTLAGYGITDAYDKLTVDEKLAVLEDKFRELYLYVINRM